MLPARDFVADNALENPYNRPSGNRNSWYKPWLLEMDCELSVSGKYIVVRVNSPMTVELGRECGAQAVELGKKYHTNMYLFDMRRSPNIENVMSNYEFARYELSNFGFSKDAYSAFLVHPEDHSHDFITTAFENAGYNVRLFTEETLAIKWLEIKGDDS